MTDMAPRSMSTFMFVALLLVGVLGRIALSNPELGWNADFGSWVIVSDIRMDGGNVYAETVRHNYGPPWAYILQGLRSIASNFDPEPYAFKRLIAGLLTLVDLGIALLLAKGFGRRASMFFFLNPISIIITSYHVQFDNFAVLIGLIAMTVYMGSKAADGVLDRHKIGGLLILGLSLMLKHILIFFPIFLAMKPRVPREKILTLAIPYGVFLAGFIPFLGGGGLAGVMNNVFFYLGRPNLPFLRSVMPWWLAHYFGELSTSRTPGAIPEIGLFPTFGKLVFVAALLCLGLYLRKRDAMTTFFMYLIGLIAFTPGLLNEYMVIPNAAIAVFPNVFFALYAIVGGAWLMISAEGLGLWTLNRDLRIEDGYVICSVMSFLLLLGLAKMFLGDRMTEWWRKKWTAGRDWLRHEIRLQFGRE